MTRLLIVLCAAAIPVLAGDSGTVVPEPSTILLMGVGLAAFGIVAHRRNLKK